MAFGRFPERILKVGGARIRVTVLRGSSEVDRSGLQDWIREGVQALTRIYGRFPVPRAHILVVPVARGGKPVPWGEVQRGGGEAVHLYIDQRRPLSEFRSDWTLAHELSYLLHPAIDYDAPWLYEGLASYYQNVVRARSGQLTAEQAWRKLHRGFRRGRRNTDDDQTLAQAARAMDGHPDYMRVYWSGAALFLLADWRLRAEDGGPHSLDTSWKAWLGAVFRAANGGTPTSSFAASIPSRAVRYSPSWAGATYPPPRSRTSLPLTPGWGCALGARRCA